MGSEAAGGLTRLIIKDPVFLNNKAPPNSYQLTRELVENGKAMFRLKEIALQGIGLNKNDLIQIAEFCNIVQTLRSVNISNNGLNMADFVSMFEILKPQTYNITKLNLAWNTLADLNIPPEVKESFRVKFADFLRYSRTLQHIDLSGMGFSEETL